MANFGTPTVIGTLSAQTATSGSTYDVPITATTTQGDYLVVAVGSAGGGTNNIPSTIADTQLQTGYANVPGATSAGVGEFSVWILPASKVLTNTDTVNVTFPVVNSFLKNIIVIDCPGALILDNAAVGNNSGTVATNGQPTIGINTTVTTELLLFFEQNSNSGGSPSISAPFNTLTTLHSGSAEYTAAAYQIVTGAPGTTTPVTTITTGTWATASIGLLNTIPLYVSQTPFPFTSPTLAFNPATQFKTPPPQPAIPTVISSAPISVPGAQANVYVNGVNFLKGDASSFNASVGNWTNGGNTTQAQTNAVSHNAQGALQATATGSGSLNLLSSTSGKITQNGMPCISTDTIFVAGWVLAAATPRTTQIGVSFLDANANVLGTTFATPSITDSTGTWQLVWGEVTGGSFPTAAWARVSVQWSSVVGSEIHYVSDVWMFNVTQGSGMGEQIQIFTPNQPSFQLQPMGVPRPLYLNGTLQFLQRQMPTGPASVFQPGVTANVNVASAGQVQVFQTFAPQFPWQQIMPGLQFIPALNWVKQQISTSNAPTYIDGGTAPNVTVNAQFPDMAAVVSVSAAPASVSVAAPSPPVVITGVTANVNVTAPTGNEVVIVVSSAPSNVSVAAIAGSTKDTVIGTVANVNVAAVNGTVTLGPAGTTALVNVAAPTGTTVVKAIGAAANVSVASTGVATVTPQGPAVNVNVAAVAGTVTESMVGTPATVAVASSGATSTSVTGAVGNVSVAAVAGTAGPVKAVQGVTANVAVASSGVAATAIAGTTANVTAAAPAGSVSRSIAGPTATVTVKSPTPAFAGMITLEGTLYDPDIALEQFLSRQGKLLSIPVEDELESATSEPQGI